MNDGGPAFPRPMAEVTNQINTESEAGHEGMSLRDWFAGQSLQTFRIDPYRIKDTEETMMDVAVSAYKVADAMLVAKRKAVVAK